MEALLCTKLGEPTLPISSDSSPITLSSSHPIPVLTTPTAVRVRIRATSLNYANYLQILGKYQEKFPLPFVPGSDYSGVVESVGAGVTRFKVGDPVCSFAAVGSYAEFLVADEKDLFQVPAGCDLVAAGALPVAFGTSHVALVHRAQLKAGQNWTVHGLYWGSYKIHEPHVLEDSLNELLSWLSRGLITIHISHTYSLSEANLAFSAIKERKVIGKVMIVNGTGTRSKL